jgi:hypothetical protein
VALMNRQEKQGMQIARALAACASLEQPSAERDALWLTVQEAVCTKGLRSVTPLGSRAPVVVSAEHATIELIAAMEWLARHENAARRMGPLRLFVMLRGVATRSPAGSGRAARLDALRGITDVPPGSPVRWSDLDPTDAA